MSSTEFTSNRDNYCYRHPDRQSFVLCQRCLRTVCPECQTPAAVGVICPECMKAERKQETPAQRKARRRWGSGGAVAAASSGRPVVTYALLAAILFTGLLQLIPGLGVTGLLQFAGVYLLPDIPFGPEGSTYPFEPWRALTVNFVHGGVWHIGLNMLSLWMLGQSLEPLLGRWRFLALFFLGGIGGSVAMTFLAPGTALVGASGAMFAMLGALLVIGRHLGANITGLLVILGINLAMGFVFPNISWQGHLGGFIAGLLAGLIFARVRGTRRSTIQTVLLVALGVVLIVLATTIPRMLLLS